VVSREELLALVRYFHHVQNEHQRAHVGSRYRRVLEDRLLQTRDRFERLLEEWAWDEDLRRGWLEHLHNRGREPDGPPEVRPLVFAGRSETSGSVVEIRRLKGEELEVRVDGSLVERVAGDKDFATRVPPARYRLNDNEFVEVFNASPDALDALADYLDSDDAPPPWEHAAELLADGLVDVHVALTPRGRRALAAR
jgi:hypothetical protein